MSDVDLLNCHYVSKFIVKPWVKNPEARWPSVDYIDVVSKTIESKRIETLFSQSGLNTRRTEDLLRDHVETPIGQARNQIIASPPDRIENWKLYAALRLIFYVQALRYGKKEGLGTGQLSLDMFLEKLEDEVFKNHFVLSLQAESQIIFLKLRPGDHLFYPETGFFKIPLERSEHTILDPAFMEVFAIPFSPSLLLMNVPNGLNALTLKKAFLSQWSTFESQGATRYILAPDLRTHFSDDEILEEFFRLRENVAMSAKLMRAQAEIGELINGAVNGKDIRELRASFETRNKLLLEEAARRESEFLSTDFGKEVLKSVSSDPELVTLLKLPPQNS